MSGRPRVQTGMCTGFVHEPGAGPSTAESFLEGSIAKLDQHDGRIDIGMSSIDKRFDVLDESAE